jgi:hypothetical protein
VAVGVASPYWMMAGAPLLRHLNTVSQNKLALNQNSPPAF